MHTHMCTRPHTHTHMHTRVLDIRAPLRCRVSELGLFPKACDSPPAGDGAIYPQGGGPGAHGTHSPGL